MAAQRAMGVNQLGHINWNSMEGKLNTAAEYSFVWGFYFIIINSLG